MRRREFFRVFGGAAAAWPLAARAQQGERMRRIGVLMHLAADDPESPTRIAALRQGLRQFGWAEGSNLGIEYRWAKGQADLFRQGAKELVQLGPDVLVASTSLAVPALQEATRTLPIVFINVVDPVGAGFAASLAAPGGNATGFALFEFGISAKWLELLKQIAPGVTRIAILRDASLYRFHSLLNRDVFGWGARNIGVNCFRDGRCDSLGPSDSEGTDGQMHQRPSPSVEDSVALERRSAAAPAHSDGAAA